MNDDPIDKNWIPNRDAGYRLPAPSASLREKILREASQAWEEDTQDSTILFWTMPTLRLAASITVAGLLVFFAHLGDDYSLARWQPSSQTTIYSQDADSYDQWSELQPGLMRIRKVAASSSNRAGSKDLMLYLQRLRESVDNTASPAVGDRHHSTETFRDPGLWDHFINPPETLES